MFLFKFTILATKISEDSKDFAENVFSTNLISASPESLNPHDLPGF